MTTKAAQILKPPISHYHFVPVASRTALPIPVIPLHNGNIQEFREQAFNPQVPVHLKNSNTPEQDLQLEHDIHHNLRKHDASIMQYEYRSSNRPPDQRAKEISFLTSQSRKRGFQLPHDIEDPRKEFHRFNAPLRLMYGSLERQSKSRIRSLYIAQMPIEELPLGMKELFPAPMDIISCGKGDIYGSSIWIGNPPTYTPLHKDPNPNIFTQHLSSKIIRLLRPSLGTGLFHRLQNQLGTQSSASFRGEEMMEGPEFHALENSIWNNKELEMSGLEHYEVVVGPGESLFIPKGWWHSIKSLGRELNVSVNWWFR